MNRFLKALILALLGTALVGLGWWGGSVALRPPEDPLADRQPVTYTVDMGSVGRSLRFAAVAEWQLEDLARNAAAGVVTSVEIPPEGQVSSGAVVFSVNLRPVTVATGTVPAFRDLNLRTEGQDVVQLQRFLADTGFYGGQIDGIFGDVMQAAVRSWQRSLDLDDDGVVRRGDLIFVPELPARIILSEDVTVGASLSGGEAVLRRVLDEVQFRIPLGSEQLDLVPLSADVEVIHGKSSWDARVADVSESEASGEVSLILEGPDGGTVCGEDCQAVPIRGQTRFPAEIIVVPETTGPVVPTAALRSLQDGSTVVTLEDGSQVPVAVLGSSDGLAVVDGVEVGQALLLPVVGEEE